jgi:UDP-2-acetamido-3-amino-2,3-dideoxy-glucuronate N-acetyltransferase
MPVANKAEGKPVEFDFTEPLRNECQHFLDCIQSRQTPRTDGAEGLRVLSVLQQCQQALEGKNANAEMPSAKLAEQPGTEAPKDSPYFAHESAFIDEGVEIGEGTSIWHVSHVLKGSRIGQNCKIGQNVVIGPKAVVGNGVKIQNNVSVYEGVTLEDGVFCGPSMVFTNVFNPRSEIPRMHELKTTLVKRGATLGANCTIICGTTIGRYALIGAGAVVSKDIPDYALAVGVPARVTGWVCACGHKLHFDLAQDASQATCSECNLSYERTSDGQIKPKEGQIT